MIYAENMILLGATARNTGKTTLAVELIRHFSRQRDVAAIKVVTVHNHGDICPRGGKGCGICKSLNTSFDIREETGTGGKDTMLFKKAGARVVYLVRAYPEGLAEAMETVLSYIKADEIVICESNSVRTVLKPGEFIMMTDGDGEVKESAAGVLGYADRVLSDYRDYFAPELPEQR